VTVQVGPSDGAGPRRRPLRAGNDFSLRLGVTPAVAGATDEGSGGGAGGADDAKYGGDEEDGEDEGGDCAGDGTGAGDGDGDGDSDGDDGSEDWGTSSQKTTSSPGRTKRGGNGPQRQEASRFQTETQAQETAERRPWTSAR
jgi:hypothetical protein